MWSRERKRVTVRMRKPGGTGIEVSACCPGSDFVDTADVHGYGETEESVGKALGGHRGEDVPAAEYNGPTGEGSRMRILTDCLDRYQLHRTDPHADVAGARSAPTGLVRAGNVRATGSSDLPASESVEVQSVSRRLTGGRKPDAVERLLVLAEAAGNRRERPVRHRRRSAGRLLPTPSVNRTDPRRRQAHEPAVARERRDRP
ncbi:aldo/keto reductase [Streptomyces sp. MP131-18]|uniref:aldo/keto reductase n=1 Tax=Streptomyces sp. MP131-18 TaxID=1857892 RepID=UPI0009C9852E|nr:aldo/keto reductase [Streptomyces sp. MP131-18]ONK12131.1 putative oxidoreductase [Streptomyces sp. MP131-18]